MRLPRFCALITALLLTVAGFGLSSPATTQAAVVPWGTVLVPGSAWAGADAARGDLNVYSNGTGSQDQPTAYGLGYECVELAVRWAQIAFGVPHSSWGIMYAYQMWAAGPRLATPFIQHPNGGADGPQFGDLLIFNQTASDPAGHVAVVSGVGPGYVDIVEQNYNNAAPTGHAELPIYGTTMPARYGLPIFGWLRSSIAPASWAGNPGPGGFLSDATGHVYPWGSAGSISEQTVWPTGATARGIATIPGTNSGYVIDNWGNLHAFGGAPRIRVSAYWFGWNIVRGFTLDPSGKGGYVLDGLGGLHPFGDAPSLAISAYWPSQDIARALVLRPDGLGGWVLDGYGGMHSFGTVPAVRLDSPYYPNQDIARGACLRSDGVSGWWVDGSNDIHSFGGATAVTPVTDFPGQDVARGITCTDDGGGYTVTTTGQVIPFGDAPALWPTPPLSPATSGGLS